MDEVRRLDCLEAVPYAARDDARVTSLQHNLRLDADSSFVAIVKNELRGSAHDVEELVAVRVHLAPMRPRPIHVADRADRVTIDSLRRPWRGGSDTH